MAGRGVFNLMSGSSTRGRHNVGNVGRGNSVSSFGRGRPGYPPFEPMNDQNESVFFMSGPSTTSTPIVHAPNPVPKASTDQFVTADALGDIIVDLAKQISDNITAALSTMNQPSNLQPSHVESSDSQPQLQSVSYNPAPIKVVVQPEARPPPLFRGDQSEPFSIHEWEDMMKNYMRRVSCDSEREKSELIMSRLAGKARDVVRVSLRSCSDSSAELPIAIFDILKRNFSELTFSSMPMKDFYGTLPHDLESAMDYWVRLNKAVDVADECLRRRGKVVEDPSAEVVMMFISYCPDPKLALSFQFKPVESWTAAEVQERLDSHIRSRRAKAQNTHCNVQYQAPGVTAPPPVPNMPPTPVTACASGLSQPPLAPEWVSQTPVLPPVSPPVCSVPTADASVQQVTALFDRVLSLCTASLNNTPPQPQHYSSQPQNYSRQTQSSGRRPGGGPGAGRRAQTQPRSPCHVCGENNHTTVSHCMFHGLCLNCYKPGHVRSDCSLPSQYSPAPVSAPAGSHSDF